MEVPSDNSRDTPSLPPTRKLPPPRPCQFSETMRASVAARGHGGRHAAGRGRGGVEGAPRKTAEAEAQNGYRFSELAFLRVILASFASHYYSGWFARSLSSRI